MKIELVRKGPAISNLPTVLFVHGVCHGAWVWELLQNLLEKMGIISYAMSLRGHGESEKPRFLRWTGKKAYMEDISVAIQQIGQPMVLIGHSMGGWLVQHYAKKYTEWVKGVIPLCAPPPWGVIGIVSRLMLTFPLTFLKLNLKLNVQEFLGTRREFAHWMLSRSYHKGMERWFQLIGPESYLIFLQMLFQQPNFKSIIVPVRVIGGQWDRCFSPSDVDALAKQYAADLIILNGPHDLMLIQDLCEKLAYQIRDFLEGALQ